MDTLTKESLMKRGKRALQDLSVGKKLITGFGAVTLILLLVVGGLLLAVYRLDQANTEVVKVPSERSHAAQETLFAAANLRATQLVYLVSATNDRNEFEQASHQFEMALRSLDKVSGDEVEAALVRKIEASYQTFKATDQLIWQAVQERRPTVAQNLANGPEALAFGFMQDDLKTVVELADQDREAALDLFQATSTQTREVGLALGALAIAVMLFASWAITKLIREPLRRVQHAAERAAEGDLDATSGVDSMDETGRLAQAFDTMLGKLRVREAGLVAEGQRQELTAKVRRAFEMAEDEPSALDVVARSFEHLAIDQPTELLLADNSKAHLQQAAVAGPTVKGPGCQVGSPFSCVAVRSGTATVFPSSESLDACPYLRDRPTGACSAICVPVTFMGRAIGVIHSTGENNVLPQEHAVESLVMLSTQAGARIGMLRTMERTHVQASTDGLTGLMNRRTFETRTRGIWRNEIPFTFVMADLDYFKRLNDSYGHETGDRALRIFAEVAKASIRENDVLCRWGGEEFALAFVDAEPDLAGAILSRLRLELAARMSTADCPPFTASFGLVGSRSCSSFEEAVRRADAALYEAKAQGRDQFVIWTPPGAANSTIEGETHGSDGRGFGGHEFPNPAVGVLAKMNYDADPLGH